jgi:hypothetical protein
MLVLQQQGGIYTLRWSLGDDKITEISTVNLDRIKMVQDLLQ